MKKYLFLLLTFYSFNSYSGLLLEPYAGLDFSTYGKTPNCCQHVSWFGLEFGGRIGYIWEAFMVGIDLDYKNLDVDYDVDLQEFEQQTRIINKGLFAGWMWEDWALRLKYYLDSDWELQEDGLYGPEGMTNSGYGFGIDGAYRFSNHINFNLEITRIFYNSVQGIKVSGGDRLQTMDILLAVSFPFDLVTK